MTILLMSFKMFIIKIIQALIIVPQLMKSQFIRPNDVYVKVIKIVCDYYECDSITFLYDTPHYNQSQEIIPSTVLKNLRNEFNDLYIQTLIIDVQKFTTLTEIYQIRLNVKKALLVFLNDNIDTKNYFDMSLSPLVTQFKAIWLIFFEDNTIAQEFFHNIYIPFDSKFMVSKRMDDIEGGEIINEVYHVAKGHELRNELFATLDWEFGALLPILSLYQRRNNLHGLLLRATVLDDPPICNVDQHENGSLTVGGFCGKVMDMLMRRLNFTTIYNITSGYGNKLNGIWYGATGDLSYNRSDIFASMMKATSQRSTEIDFPMPLYQERYRLFIKKSSSFLIWDKFLKPFSRDMWIVLGSMMIIISGILTTIEILNKIEDDNEQGIKNKIFRFFDTIFVVFSAFCNQVFDNEPPTNPGRIAQLILHSTAYIVLAAYSAVLISSLTVQTYNPPFTNLHDLLKNPSYRMGLVKTGADYALFRDSNDTIFKNVFTNIVSKEETQPLNPIEGLTRLCTISKYVFLTSVTAASAFHYKDCSIMPLEVISTPPMVFGLPKNSPFRDLINIQILLLKENGLLAKSISEMRPVRYSHDSYSSVELVDVMPLLVFLISSAAISIVIICGELFINKQIIRSNQRRNSHLMMGLNDIPLAHFQFKN